MDLITFGKGNNKQGALWARAKCFTCLINDHLEVSCKLRAPLATQSAVDSERLELDNVFCSAAYVLSTRAAHVWEPDMWIILRRIHHSRYLVAKTECRASRKASFKAVIKSLATRFFRAQLFIFDIPPMRRAATRGM